MAYTVITNREQLEELVEEYLADGLPFAFDVETVDTAEGKKDRGNPLIAPVTWISLANKYSVDVIPIGHPNGAQTGQRRKPNKKGSARLERGVQYADLNPKYDLSTQVQKFFDDPPEHMKYPGAVMGALQPLFESDLLKIGHNIKFDLHALAKYVGMPQGPYFDTMIASWLFDSRRVRGKNIKGIGGLSLEDCVRREGLDPQGELVKGIGKQVEDHAFDEVAMYSALDAQFTYDLYVTLSGKFTPQIQHLMDLEMAVLYPILDMEQTGVRIDVDTLRTLDREFRHGIERLEGEIWKATGPKFNMRSNKEKQELLFRPKKQGGLGIRSKKLTPGGKTKAEEGLATSIYDKAVDSEVLEANAHEPVVRAMLDHSSLAKLHGTYVLPYLGGMPIGQRKIKSSQLRNGRVYAQFKQQGTETGRMSSANPNLQNIPSRTPEGGRIREIFVADEDEVLVVADYSQIEPRIIASLSGDPTMIETYRSGGDVYQAVGDRMSVERRIGKTLVLAIAYGVGAKKISLDAECSVSEAEDLMSFFSKTFPHIPKHKQKVVAKARTNLYSSTILGRRRYLDIRSKDFKIRSMAERQAYNHLIQGSAADIMKIALANVHAMLPEQAKMLMTVHDEIVITVPVERADEVVEIVRVEMEAAKPSVITVPLEVEIQTGYRWSEAKG